MMNKLTRGGGRMFEPGWFKRMLCNDQCVVVSKQYGPNRNFLTIQWCETHEREYR